MSIHKIVIWSDNWADEMDLEGFKLMTNEEYESYIAGWKRVFELKNTYTLGVGTNEIIEYESWEQFQRTLNTIPLERNEHEIIRDNVGPEFGFFPDVPDDDMIEAFGGRTDEDD